MVTAVCFFLGKNADFVGRYRGNSHLAVTKGKHNYFERTTQTLYHVQSKNSILFLYVWYLVLAAVFGAYAFLLFFELK